MRLPQMSRPLTAALFVLTILSACGFGQSRLNPLNWFGRSAPAEQVVSVTTAPTDPRPLVAQVLSMTIEPYPGGALVRATGLPPTQGHWDAELVPLPVDENGTLVLKFHIFPPVVRAGVVNQQSREVTVAYSLSAIKLSGISQIIVQGQDNARASRR